MEWIRAFSQWLTRTLRLTGGASSRAELDPELRDAFCAELGEIEHSLSRAVATWQNRHTDPGALKDLRRGFHTIKGSASLVGANEIGEVYRHLERLSVQLTERPRPPTPALLETLQLAVALLPQLAECLQHDRPLPAQAKALSRRAQSLLG